MYKAVALTSIAALAGQTMALNAHRHQHQMDKRAMETTWCTVWETVYVTVDPVASTPAAAASATSSGFGAKDVPNPTGAGNNNAGAAPTVTSTSTIVVPTSTHAASSAAAPAKHSTTLVTAVRQSSAAAPVKSSSSSSEPAAPVSSAPASSKPAASSTPAPPTSSETPTPTPTPTPSSSSKAAPPPSTSSKAATPSQPASPPCFRWRFPRQACCEKCHWAYNWGFWPSGIDTSKYSYVPTLWGPQPEHSNGFDAQAEAALASGSKAIFSFNECDIASQCNLPPAAAASAHAQFLNKYSGKALIGAPSVSNSGAANQGLDWLQQFVSACNAQSGGCAFDFCNVHWYSPASAIDTFFSHIEGANKICGGKPVIITEFAPSGTDAEISAFLEQALPKLDSLDYVMGYSYFMVGANSLMNAAGNAPSDFGNTYATV
ncbi:hypothetical protein TrVGV298_008491 [Trichoderma virens]|nr:hypothetical protein TrVGV298_008491 [Trichoderma virens]